MSAHLPGVRSRLLIRHSGERRLRSMRFSGFTTGFLGPVAVGIVLDWFGGAVSVSGWRAGYLVIAIGSAVAAWAVWRAPESKSNIRVERGPDSRQLGPG